MTLQNTEYNLVNGITKRTIYNHRYNVGVNLDSMFLIEPWNFESMFGQTGVDEYGCVMKQLQSSNVEVTAAMLEKHYDYHINKIDWKTLKEKATINSVRVSIGYWHVDNGSFLSGLPYNALTNVYKNAQPWERLKKLVKMAAENEIGVLIDFHASSNRELLQEFQLRKITEIILPFVVTDICDSHENVIGIQLSSFKSNEAGALQKLTELDPSLPIVVNNKKLTDISRSVVLDLQEDTISMSKPQADLVISKFRGPKLLSNNGELNLANWGSFYWTLEHKVYGSGTEGLLKAIMDGSVQPITSKLIIDESRIQKIVQEHENYWKDKGNYFEHWRFEDSLRNIARDIVEFSKFGNSRIGRWEAWRIQSRAKHVAQYGESSYMWEWEQGFQRGLFEFNHY